MQVSPVLFGIGVAADLLGIFFLAGPDFVPEGERLSRWLGREFLRVGNLLRRLVGRPPRRVVQKVGLDSAIGFESSASAIVGTGATSLEDKVEFLLRRDQDAQRERNELAGRVKRLEDESPRQLAETKQEMKEHVARELAAAHERYRPLRQAGAILLLVGVVCLALATFLG